MGLKTQTDSFFTHLKNTYHCNITIILYDIIYNLYSIHYYILYIYI